MKASSSISSLVSPVLASQGRLLPGFRALGISGFSFFFFFFMGSFRTADTARIPYQDEPFRV